jgi:hypothetical protein
MIEVFKTNVEEVAEAERIIELLLQHYPAGRINFDLQDCDKILRVVNDELCPEEITRIIETSGYQCEALE